MRHFKNFGLALICVIGVTLSLGAEERQGPSDDEIAAMMSEAMKYAAPGEHHQHLDPLEGSWNFTSKFRISPHTPWEESTGTGEYEWVLGGRFLQHKIHGLPSKSMPMEFHGLGLIGYDNFAEEYVHLWMDNFFTGVIVFKGSCSDSGKVITLSGEVTKPIKGGLKVDSRWVYKIISDDKFVFEMWEPDENGDDYLHGEITYTRAP